MSAFSSNLRPNAGPADVAWCNVRVRAFTLIELIVVMSIVVTMSAVAIMYGCPAVQAKQRSATMLVERDLAYVRDLAVQTGTPTWVDIVLASQRIDYRQGATRAAASTITNPATGQAFVTQLDTTSDNGTLSSIQFGTVNGVASPATYQFGFDYLGRPIDTSGSLLTSTISITVKSPYYSACTLAVQPESGMIAVTMP